MAERVALRALRESKGLTQTQLAGRCGTTRQSLSAIEAGRVDPSVTLALALAEALGGTVETLFGRRGAPTLGAEAAERLLPGAPVLVGSVGGRFVAHATGRHGSTPPFGADGSVLTSSRGLVQIACERPADDAVFVAGCAPVLGALLERLSRSVRTTRYVWLPRATDRALDLLSRRLVHVAGIHSFPEISELTTKLSPGLSAFTLVGFTTGLARPLSSRVRSLQDLRARDLRLALREPGSGARRVFDRQLSNAGVEASHLDEESTIVDDHADAARIVSLGLADAGLTIGPVAHAHALDLLPLELDRFDLVIPTATLDDPPIRALVEAMNGKAFRKEARALGYDVEQMGAEIR
ncbi:MAG: helix-turn-helix domain-containing protein [Deltaproteobacteria bacterium]|nr:helix-turn-helix domain-containing protein [Deltaproteobacteria bacterium]